MEPEYIASISGGKDSTAMALHLMEQGIEFDPVFFDTGWEHAAVYEYIENDLPRVLGKPVRIVEGRVYDLDEETEQIAREFEARLDRRSAMVRLCLHKAMFPSRIRRWCTQLLKIEALKAVLADLDLPVNCVGIRSAESAARAKLPERELSTSLDCMVWRPILAWTKADVIAIHNRHGIAPNRLYLQGAERVGCWPCIFSRKSEVRFMSETDPARIDLLADLEAAVFRLARRKKAEDPEALARLEEMPPAWFTVSRAGKSTNQPARAAAEWSRTKRGGRQMSMFREDEIVPGCLQWGLCDTGDLNG
jgi:3'-phosphoadenosine 5'-phosphosulfate sulfotransferase (PAPS reductase)/FAD synthetase